MGVMAGRPLGRMVVLGICGVGVIVVIAGVTAIVAPPNTYDSMTYHLPRMMHWIQHQSVAHYPTHIPRQLHFPPGAEFILTHLHILAGNDRLLNLVQWLGMVGSVVGVSLLAQQFGAAGPGQVVASVVAATLPMGMLQASSTQNDYVVTFWLVCLAYFVLVAIRRPGWGVSAGVGASLGLALLTKATAYLFAAPLLVWLLVGYGRSMRWHCYRHVLLIAGVVLALNLGHWLRNARPLRHAAGLGGRNECVVLYERDLRCDDAALQRHQDRQPARQRARRLRAGPSTDRSAVGAVDRPGTRAHRDGCERSAHHLAAGDDVGGAAIPRRAVPHARGYCRQSAALVADPVRPRRGLREWGAETEDRCCQSTRACWWPVFCSSAWCSSGNRGTAGCTCRCLCCGHRPWVLRYRRAGRVGLGQGAAAVLLVVALVLIGYNETRPLYGPRSIFTTERADQYFATRPFGADYRAAIGYLNAQAHAATSGWSWARMPGSIPSGRSWRARTGAVRGWSTCWSATFPVVWPRSASGRRPLSAYRVRRRR